MTKTESMFDNMTTTIGDDQMRSVASLNAIKMNASKRLLWKKRIDGNFKD